MNDSTLQLGLRLHDSAALPFEERLHTIREQGFSCVHLALKKTAGLPAEAESLTPGYAMWLRRQFDRAGLDVAVLGCYLNLANPNREKLAVIQETYRAHLRFASILGAGVVGTETGAPNETYTCDDSCRSQYALDLFISNLRPVIRDAERMGVILAIEPVAKHIVSTPERARTVLDSIPSPNLQIIFDPVNLLDASNVDCEDEVISNAIEILGRDIAVVHLKDYTREFAEDGSLRSLKACGCGQGEMHYDRILRFMKTEKPYIHATLENTTPENAEQCRRFIEEQYGKV